jgi:polysaccharide export outer membrane protein
MDSAKLSATLNSLIFCLFRMNNAGFSHRLTRPVAGFTTLLTLMTIAIPTPSMAQKPVLQKIAPESFKISLRQFEAAYTLGAGDRIRLDIFSIPEYSGEYQVLVDGTLNLPIIGSVSVQGQTLQSASSLISSRYARYVRRPIITLSLLTPRPLKIAISGEVNRAGSYTVPLTDGRQFPTVTQAIQLAGGTTQAANVRQVVVRRRQGGQTFNINLAEVLDNGSGGSLPSRNLHPETRRNR